MPKDKNETIEITQGIVLPPSEDGETDQALIDNFLSHSDEEYTQMGEEIEEAERKKEEKEKENICYSRLNNNYKNRLNGKEHIHGHCACDDGLEGLNRFGEDLIKYEIGDEYIPVSSCCAQEIGTILDANILPIDIVKCYDSGDRFIVERPTYYEYFKYDRESIKCWLVNIRSQKTGKVYRALSN